MKITITTLSGLRRNEDASDYERDETGERIGYTTEVIWSPDEIQWKADVHGSYDKTGTKWISLTTVGAVVMILTERGCHRPTGTPNIFEAEPYVNPYYGTWEEVTAVLEGFTPEQLKDIAESL